MALNMHLYFSRAWVLFLHSLWIRMPEIMANRWLVTKPVYWVERTSPWFCSPTKAATLLSGSVGQADFVGMLNLLCCPYCSSLPVHRVLLDNLIINFKQLKELSVLCDFYLQVGVWTLPRNAFFWSANLTG